jgi:hypothetical protein
MSEPENFVLDDHGNRWYFHEARRATRIAGALTALWTIPTVAAFTMGAGFGSCFGSLFIWLPLCIWWLDRRSLLSRIRRDAAYLAHDQTQAIIARVRANAQPVATQQPMGGGGEEGPI